MESGPFGSTQKQQSATTGRPKGAMVSAYLVPRKRESDRKAGATEEASQHALFWSLDRWSSEERFS